MRLAGHVSYGSFPRPGRYHAGKTEGKHFVISSFVALSTALATDSWKFEEKWREIESRSEALGAIGYHVPRRLIDRLNSRSRERATIIGGYLIPLVG